MTTEDEVRALRKLLVGNGEVGLVERVRSQEHLIAGIRADLSENTKKLDQLVRERREDAARREGSLNALKWVKWSLSLLLTIVILGGSFGMYRINSQWEQVQQQIQRIPALPE